MGYLRIYAPDDATFHVDPCDPYQESEHPGESPEVLPLHASRMGIHWPTSQIELIQRSRLLHENRKCRHCHRPVVQLIHNNDAFQGRGQLPVPGTATLLGFRCEYCRRVWTP